jgi:hypothetical protein
MRRFAKTIILLAVISVAFGLNPVSVWAKASRQASQKHSKPSKSSKPALPKIKFGDLSRKVLGIAYRYYTAHLGEIRNRRYITIIDYSKPSCSRRMFTVDLRTGKVGRYLVAHGRNSGRVYATSFSNRRDSFKSSKGFFLTGRTFWGRHGKSLVLHGLDRRVNDNAANRGIVIHGADYVSARSIRLNKGRLGRSLGCPAMSKKEINQAADRIKGGSLVYVYAK